jgi:hypothetical protein
MSLNPSITYHKETHKASDTEASIAVAAINNGFCPKHLGVRTITGVFRTPRDCPSCVAEAKTADEKTRADAKTRAERAEALVSSIEDDYQDTIMKLDNDLRKEKAKQFKSKADYSEFNNLKSKAGLKNKNYNPLR